MRFSCRSAPSKWAAPLVEVGSQSTDTRDRDKEQNVHCNHSVTMTAERQLIRREDLLHLVMDDRGRRLLTKTQTTIALCRDLFFLSKTIVVIMK